MNEADDAATTLAIGGQRRIPVPDAVARDYLLLALRLEQHVPGLVDGYFGPADLKARSDVEELRPPSRLVDDAQALLARVADEVPEPDRREWLTVQVVALGTQAEALAGVQRSYLDHVERCFAWRPLRRDPGVFEASASAIDALLPGPEPLAARLAGWDDRFVVPPDRVADVASWLVATFRNRAATLFGLPDREELGIRLVHGQPWSGYNWFDGGRRSRVEINTDLTVRVASLVHLAAHESYPGHHLEHAWKEAELVDGRHRLEASVLLINTPECLISEGLADLGYRFAVPPEQEAALLVELYERAGLPLAADPVAAREAAETTIALREPRERLSESRVNAALLRHEDGRSHDEVLDFLERVGRYERDIARKRLEFIEHPLWRTYVFVYAEGQALLRRWLEHAPPAAQVARFGRLLREQLSPAAIAAELADQPRDVGVAPTATASS